MAYQSFTGSGPYLPEPYNVSIAPNLTSLLIDATGEKIAFIGHVWNKDHTTKDIRKVGFRFGTVTKAGGSALTVSLQNVNTAANPPQPDETQDETVAIANVDAGFATGLWYQTGALSADRTVAFGELLAVVIEYDGAGRLSTDVVNITSLASAISPGFPTVNLKSGTWALQGQVPNIILEFDDGTFGTLSGSMPLSASTVHAFKQDTGTSDEFANEFSFPFPCKVDGCWFALLTAAVTSNFDVVLYDGTTPLVTVSIDADTIPAASAKLFKIPFAEQTLVANTVYRLAIKPTQTTSTVTIYSFEVSAADHFQAHPLGSLCILTTRLDEGAWAAATTTRRLFMGLRVSALDDGVGGAGGGGLIRHPGMSGGLNA